MLNVSHKHNKVIKPGDPHDDLLPTSLAVHFWAIPVWPHGLQMEFSI
jgi:hypothetical protein